MELLIAFYKAIKAGMDSPTRSFYEGSRPENYIDLKRKKADL